jgi:bacterioferritin-associated ferredoxin
MYVCVCRAISDRQIREVVNRGAESLDEVKAYLPVAGCCGSCEDTARELITSYKNSSSKQAAA